VPSPRISRTWMEDILEGFRGIQSKGHAEQRSPAQPLCLCRFVVKRDWRIGSMTNQGRFYHEGTEDTGIGEIG